MSGNVIKIIGIVASVVGMGASMVGAWASDKQADAKIAEKVSEAIANLNKE
jgi:hypothetical protein